MAQTDWVKTAVKTQALNLKLASTALVAIPTPKKKNLAPKEEKQVVSSARPEAQALRDAAPSNGLSSMGRADLKSLYQAELRSLIEKNKTYPPASLRMGQTGKVIVAFTLQEDGHIIDVRIDSPSSYERLDASALEAVKKVGKFKPIPKELGLREMAIRVPINFYTI